MNSPDILKLYPPQADTPYIKSFSLQRCYPSPTRRDRQGTIKGTQVNRELAIRMHTCKWVKISHLPDILVPDSADLLDVGSTLRNILEGVSGQLELVLDVGGGDDLDTGLGSHTTNVLLAEEVSVGSSISVFCSPAIPSIQAFEPDYA